MPARAAPARLWIFHHRLFHYRLPFWDRLQQLGQGRYSITCFGESDGKRSIGGAEREYLEPTPVRGGLGGVGYTFEGGTRRIREERPEMVMVVPNPRNRLSWQVPDICRTYGGVCIAWSKVHSATALPGGVLRGMKRRLYLQYDLAFTYGPASTQELISLGFESDRIYTAFNTIDTSRIFEARGEIRSAAAQLRREHRLEEKKLLVCVAKFSPQKRHRDLLRAWPQLSRMHPDLTLVLVGRGPLAARIKEDAAKLDPKRILFVGEVPEGHDYDWLAAADASIQCGAVGLAINQSMALGTPTIIADEPGVDAEVVQHGVTGWRYRKGDINDLVVKVGNVLGNPGERERITAAAVAFIRSEASIDQMAACADRCVSHGLELVHSRRSLAVACARP